MDRPRPGGPPRGVPQRPNAQQANSLETGKFRPKGIVSAEAQRRKARERRIYALRLGGYLVGGAALAALVFWLVGSKPACRQTPERERALATLLGQKDARTGEPLGDQLAGSEFNCEESTLPPGVLVAIVDTAGPSIVWWVDEKAKLHNVNLLSKAYTPYLPAAPFLPDQIKTVARPDDE